MKPLFLKIIVLLSFAACNSNQKISKFPYKLVGDDLDIKVEQFDSTITDVNRYNYNNKIFTIGREFIYSFDYRTVNDERFFFIRTEEDWEFIPQDMVDEYTIENVSIQVLSGLKPMIDYFPDYNQTLLKYRLENENNHETSGVIENEVNVWMHPPRTALFKILELNPFPYVQFPLKIANKWKWKLKIGSSWGDERWRKWDGIISNTYDYVVADELEIETNFGNLKCFEIFAIARSDLGETTLRFWFNNEYGFVRMNYGNIDGSMLNLELIELNENKGV